MSNCKQSWKAVLMLYPLLLNRCFLSWQDREQELEQLTKELRQVNLQQFIQQTGTKVTVLPADPVEVEAPHVELERGAALRMVLVGGEGDGNAFTCCLNASSHT